MDWLPPSPTHTYTHNPQPHDQPLWPRLHPGPHGVSEQQWFRTSSLDPNTVNGRRNMWEAQFPRSLEIWWRWNWKKVNKTDDKPRCLNATVHTGARTHARTHTEEMSRWTDIISKKWEIRRIEGYVLASNPACISWNFPSPTFSQIFCRQECGVAPFDHKVGFVLEHTEH